MSLFDTLSVLLYCYHIASIWLDRHILSDFSVFEVRHYLRNFWGLMDPYNCMAKVGGYFVKKVMLSLPSA